MTGTSCKHGHISPRSTSSGGCITCRDVYYQTNKDIIKARSAKWAKHNPENRKISRRKYRDKNLEREQEYGAQYRGENKNKILLQTALYRESHRELLNQKNHIYFKRNKHIFRAQAAKRRSRLLKATPKWAVHEAIKVIYLKAKELEDTDGIKRAVDHIVPLAGKIVCGLHVENNLRIISKKENLKKGSRYDI